MKFSIIIPVYNVDKYLRECIDSVISQINIIEDGAEILLIDDGSTDTSGKICDEYKAKYPNIIYSYHKNNEGLLLTRRFGYKKAKGEYIVNCDSDDMLENDYFKIIIESLKKYKDPDMILFNYNAFDEYKKEIGFKNIFTKEKDCQVPKEEIYKKFLLHHGVVSVCGKVFKKNCIDVEKDYKNIGIKNNGEDTLQSIEFINNAKSFVYINEALYDYRGGSGMTTKFDANYFKSFKPALTLIYEQKNKWNLADFDKLFSIKVLQTAGRAITQSRYNKWDSYNDHKNYLLEIKNDYLLQQNLVYLNDVKDSLQKTHYLCLTLLKNNCFLLLSIMLRVRSII